VFHARVVPGCIIYLNMVKWEKIERELIEGLKKGKSKYDFIFLNNAQGVLRRRVFNEGKAEDGSDIGQYSAAYMAIRESKGQETSRVNLEDTGELRRSIQVGNSDGEIVLGIAEKQYEHGYNTPENARGQEKIFKKEIFSLSDEEIEQASKGADDLLNKELDVILQKAFK
jgi:hypothetical protein